TVLATELIGSAGRPSKAQRLTDLNGCLAHMKPDIQSGAGGVRPALIALHVIEAGTEQDVGTATGIATHGAQNCSPANNMLLEDLVGYQVQESLFSFRLDRVVYGLVDWATPDAWRVQNDVAAVLRTQGAARAAAHAKLTADLRILDNQRTYLDRIMLAAIKATGASGHPPPLPG